MKQVNEKRERPTKPKRTRDEMLVEIQRLIEFHEGLRVHHERVGSFQLATFHISLKLALVDLLCWAKGI